MPVTLWPELENFSLAADKDSYPFFHVCAPAGPEWNIMPPASSWPTKPRS